MRPAQCADVWGKASTISSLLEVILDELNNIILPSCDDGIESGSLSVKPQLARNWSRPRSASLPSLGLLCTGLNTNISGEKTRSRVVYYSKLGCGSYTPPPQRRPVFWRLFVADISVADIGPAAAHQGL